MTQPALLTGRVVLISGAAGAVGAAARAAFESAGATLVRGGPPGSDSEWKWFDAADPASADAAVGAAVAGHGRIDVLVNLAGAWSPQPPVHEMPDDVLDRLVTVNFRTAFVMTRAALPHMLRHGWGRIINVGGKAGLKGAAGNAAYSVAKASVIALTEAVADEIAGTGVTANVVIPSTVDTPANRRAMPKADFSKWVAVEALAETMVFLCTDAGGQINGARIPVYNRA